MNLDLLIAALGGLFVLVVMVFGLRFLYDYRVHNHAIEVVLFHLLPVYRIPIANIESIQKASWSELGIGGSTLRLGNRVFGQGVLIRSRSGWFRRVVISPEDADRFISRVAAG
jgi:hypothetical protein